MVDVLVVGAGPAGLLAASELLRHGARVRVIDAAPGPALTSRALATHGRTLEIYDQVGILDEVVSRGQPCTAFVRHSEGAEPVRFDFGYSDTPIRYEFNLMIDQTITEEILRSQLTRLGGRIEWNTRLDALAQDTEHVRAAVTGPSGARGTIEIPWLVGCDGAHSVVRRSLGIALLGESTRTWLVADAEVDVDLDRTAAHLLFGDGGASLMFAYATPGRWRLVDLTHAADGDSPATVVTRFARRLRAATGHPVTVGEPSWISTFTIQQRAVPEMRSGRCFLAGDAAHVHSPAGGQGMNTGLQEAFNLGWKLAAVVKGEATQDLLDSYAIERVPIGRALLASTAAITNYLVSPDDREHEAARLADTGREIIGTVQATGIAYHHSPLTTPAPRDAVPRPGERVTRVDTTGAQGPGWTELLARLREPRWILLLLAMTLDDLDLPRRADWLTVLTLDDRRLAADLDAAHGGWLLIRPDGYLAARGEPTTPITLPASYPTPGRSAGVEVERDVDGPEAQ